MSKIDARFYKELFLNKSVKLSQQYYVNLYNAIWPCEELFKQYLYNTDFSLKLKYAKKIYSYFLTSSNIFIPKEYIENVIFLQQTKLVKNASYTPQDHIVHSVNLYILGIYLFFNVPIFHKSIITQMDTQTKLDDRISLFVEKWKLFALYHDIGYFLEANVDKNGNYQKQYHHYFDMYSTLSERLVYYHVIRIVARIITCVAVLKNSHQTFQLENLSNITDKNNITDNLLERLKDFDNCIILENISSKLGFEIIESVFDSERMLLLYIDNNGKLKRIESLDGDNTVIFNDDFDLLNSVDYSIRYVIQSEKSVYGLDCGLASGFFDELPEKLKIKYKFICTDSHLCDFYHDVFCWLLENTEFDMNNNNIFSYEKLLEKYYSKAIIDSYSEIIEAQLPKNVDSISKSDLKTLVEHISQIVSQKRITDKVLENIQNLSTKLHLEENGIAYDILQFCSVLYNNIGKDICDSYSNTLRFILNKNNRLALKIFTHDEKVPFENELYEQIARLSECLNININRLCEYNTPYSNCDHGLVSAGLLYQTICFNHKLHSIHDKHISMSWLGKYEKQSHDKHLITFADVIFAILLHNIYVEDNNHKYGVNYTQQIDKNSFSYFCTFCDNLQNWGRQKQIDASVIDLPDIHFLEDDFDILVDNGYIIVLSNNANEDAMKEKLEENATFLQGIHNILRIGKR